MISQYSTPTKANRYSVVNEKTHIGSWGIYKDENLVNVFKCTEF